MGKYLALDGVRETAWGPPSGAPRGPQRWGKAAFLSPRGPKPHRLPGPSNKRPQFQEPQGQCRRTLAAAVLTARVLVLAGPVDKCAKGPGISMRSGGASPSPGESRPSSAARALGVAGNPPSCAPSEPDGQLGGGWLVCRRGSSVGV